jgi:hypothetical protein
VVNANVQVTALRRKTLDDILRSKTLDDMLHRESGWTVDVGR